MFVTKVLWLENLTQCQSLKLFSCQNVFQFLLKHAKHKNKQQTIQTMVGSSGLVVMGGGLRSEGGEFKSLHHVLDGHFSLLFVVRILMFVWKDESKQKRGRGWPK